MKLWKNDRAKQHIPIHQPNKNQVLVGLKLCCDYLERNIQNDLSFKPEFEASSLINSLLENNDPISETHLFEIIKVMGDIDKQEHYNGSGWLDYKLRLSYFLHLSGFDTDFIR